MIHRSRRVNMRRRHVTQHTRDATPYVAAARRVRIFWTTDDCGPRTPARIHILTLSRQEATKLHVDLQAALETLR